ncbi:MAG: glycogen-binding domain-containing protein [Desulfobacterales bacterium]|nr:glycogen-binding domain-containing protein [Desulfobacterales bacterium]
MKDYMISMFIDDELSLDDKIEFVETVHEDKIFKKEAVDLIRQEKLLRSDIVEYVPSVVIREKHKIRWSMLRPITMFLSGLAAAGIILFFTLPSQINLSKPYRFIIFQPDISQAEITGSFTGWTAVPMKKLGPSGYWEITLDLPGGEHRFSYILEGDKRIADPTILAREQDDFGGENSILEVSI